MQPGRSIIALVILIWYALAGCSAYRWASVEPGEYTVVRAWLARETVAVRELEKLEVGRNKGQIVFTSVDGSELSASFTARDLDTDKDARCDFPVTDCTCRE